MPDVTVSSLDSRLQKQVENAQTALQRGNLDYVLDVAAQVLKAAPGCLPVRKLLRTAQLKNQQSKSKLGLLVLELRTGRQPGAAFSTWAATSRT